MDLPIASPVGLLLSGGMDSTILLSQLLGHGRVVQPFYVRSGHVWQTAERAANRAILDRYRGGLLRPLVELDLPLADLDGDHWSFRGVGTPSASSPDEAVFLPGRNLLLVIKPALWCQMHGIPSLVLATLGTSPFADATPAFFQRLERLLGESVPQRLSVSSPFQKLDKRQVMELGVHAPLELTFSCLVPHDGLHCGDCNKCAERQMAFASIGMPDPTVYARRLESGKHA